MSDRPRNRHLDAVRAPRRMIHVDACGEDALEEMAEELDRTREECTIATCVAELAADRADLFEGIVAAMVADAFDVDAAGNVFCKRCAATSDRWHEDDCAIRAAELALADDRGGDSEVEA